MSRIADTVLRVCSDDSEFDLHELAPPEYNEPAWKPKILASAEKHVGCLLRQA